MHVAQVIADGYRYPAPDSLPSLAAAIESSTTGVVKRHLTRFVDEVGRLPLGEWEELHTSTLDLSPQFVPYVGHVVWGENYRRGEFMADLNRSMHDAGIELDGELPDHIAPVLRYLAVADEPLPDLVEVLSGAVATMAQTLHKADAKNPYRHLLAATADYASDAARPAAPLSELRLRRNSQRGTPVQFARSTGNE